MLNKSGPTVGVSLVLVLCLAIAWTNHQPNRPVIVLGVDGLDPDTIELLTAEGKLPNLQKMRSGGAYGRLRSMRPMLSPVLWTTIATGREPLDHGIGHFVTVNQRTGTEIPVTSRMRRTKALWTLLSEAGREVGVVGWWATWPAETVRGSIISDHVAYHFLFEKAFDADGAERGGLVSPPELWPQVSSLVQQPSDVQYSEIQKFASVDRAEFDREFDFKSDLAQLRWILSTTKSYARIGHHLWMEQRPDLLMLYIEGTDSASHLFGHLFRQPTLAGAMAEQQERFGSTVEAMYTFADEIVGTFLDILDRDAVLVVVSDHGFALGASLDDPSKAGDLRRVSAEAHEDEGVLFMYGEPIVSGAAIQSAKLLDITPTILALSGLQPSNDMPGRILQEALKQPHEERRVSTYENSRGIADAEVRESPVDDAILEHLRSLGYLDTSSPATEKNLAASAFSRGRYQEAAAAFRSLIAKSDSDSGLYVGLAGSLGALGDYPTALDALSEAERIDPLQPEIYHNRAVIYERQRRIGEAIDEYEKALRLSSNYEPSRSALMRLTGSDVVRAPLDNAERRALELAQSAQLLAKRGDYDSAWSTIEAAEHAAPNYVVVFQYQANIAYLRGDYDSAMIALRKAIQLEPENPLYRANLETLKLWEKGRGSSPPPGTTN